MCFFVSEDWYFCSHRLDLATYARKHGFDVGVIVRVGKLGQKIRDAGLSLFPVGLSRRSINPFSEIKVIWHVYRYYKNYKPDIVHNVALKPVIYGTIAAKLAGVPVVVNAFAGLGWLFSSSNFKVIKSWRKSDLRIFH